MNEEIDQYNREHFGFTQEEIEAQRLPIDIMFPGMPSSGKK